MLLKNHTIYDRIKYTEENDGGMYMDLRFAVGESDFTGMRRDQDVSESCLR